MKRKGGSESQSREQGSRVGSQQEIKQTGRPLSIRRAGKNDGDWQEDWGRS